MLSTILSKIVSNAVPLGVVASVGAVWAARNTEACLNLGTVLASALIPLGIGYFIIKLRGPK